MCDVCDRLFDRRSILRHAFFGGSAIAGGTLLPRGMRAFAGGDDAATAAFANPAAFEIAAMGEDRRLAVSLLRAGSGSARTARLNRPAIAPAPSASGAIRGVRLVPAPNADALQAPPIVSRAQWGADESIRVDTRSYAPVRKLIVHHSASDNLPRSPMSVVRLIDLYHTRGRGFTDTGYNYLIDQHGVIYEGRAARRYAPGEVITDEDNRGWGVVGAHAKGNNAGSCGICLIGDFDRGSPTDAAIASLTMLLAYKASRHRIDPSGNDEYIDLYGNHRVYPNIAGHRQVGQTACPGRRLYALLPSLRSEVARRTGPWPSLTVDIPDVLRWEVGTLRSPSPAATPPATSPGSGVASDSSSPGPGSGTKLVGYRIVSSTGTVYTAGKARKQGNPSASGGTDIVALTNTTRGDGYWALGRNGTVYAFGGVPHVGDATGKGAAVDIAATASGEGYWVLTADGGIYPFGDAGFASSPKKSALGGTSRRIVARPQNDGYWVLMAGNIIRPFGAAPLLGAPAAASGHAIDVAVTPSGAGYWVLTDTGSVLGYGDAGDHGDPLRSKWKRASTSALLLATPSGKGYVVADTEGAITAFGDAPVFGTFAGSGMHAAGLAPAFG